MSPAAAAVPGGATIDCAPTPGGGDPPGVVEGGLHLLTPTRVLDTRQGLGPVGGGCTVLLDLGDAVPADAVAVSLSVTAVDVAVAGYVTAYACDLSIPTASNLNPRPGAAVSNTVVVPLAASRQVCLFTATQSQLIADLGGWFGVDGEPFNGLAPTRVLDTRGAPRPDGGAGPLAAGSVTRVPIAGTGPVPGGATGVLLNATVTETQAQGWLTVFPCGATPFVSPLTYQTADTRAVQLFAGLDATGATCVYTPVGTQVIFDVTGWFGGDDGSRLVPLTGTRVLDSRDETGGWDGPIPPGEVRPVDVTLEGTLPVGQNVLVDVVATGADGGGYVALFPCGGPVPATSSLNLGAGETVANLTGVPVGEDGRVCVYANVSTHVIIDVVGSLGAPGPLLRLDLAGGTLTTAFTPDGHNYGVICEPGTNSWTFSTDAVYRAAVTVAGGDPGGTVTVSTGDAVVITATPQGGPSTEYWVRCLPSDFPVLDTRRRDVVAPGWYLVSPVSSRYAVILDDHGAPVWYQNAGNPVIDASLLPDGTLAWTALLGLGYGTDPGGAYQVHTLDGTFVRQWATIGAITDHHDLQPLPGGNMLMISYHRRDNVDVSALGPGYPSPSSVVDTWIQEITPAGTLAWSWHSEDHIAVAETVAQLDQASIIQTVGSPTQVLDLVHANSVDVDPVTGDVIVSARHLDAVLRIRRSPGQPDDGTVLWKLGGNAPTSATTTQLTILGDPFGGPRRQHDARLLPDGNITLFDNQSFHPGTSSRGVEYTLDLTAGTATMVGSWGRTDGQQAFGLGSMRRMPDGSTIIGWGAITDLLSDYLPGHPSRPALKVLLQTGDVNYRALKIPFEVLGEGTLRATAGGGPVG